MAQWGRGQSSLLVMRSLRLHSISYGLFASALALGAAERRPAAVYSPSPACIRHPGCAGTDPDTCHQRSTGMSPRGAGLELASGCKGVLSTQLS